MMNPVLLQKQLKDNANDLSDFYKDLKTWGEDMKRKEETDQKTKEKKEGLNNKNKKRKKLTDHGDGDNNKHPPAAGGDFEQPAPPTSKIIGGTDYKAWDKFDADAECEKVDYNENDEDSLTDECDDTAKDQAMIEKDKGNKFVKDKKWQEAIKCYTKAIDCYSYDPIFYANRALCYLRTNNPTQAENDCNLSLKLDSTYVKAYQRRAAAREALGRLEEAEVDLEKVLEFEPKNQESGRALDGVRKKLEEKKKASPEQPPQRPVSKFTASRMNRNITAHTGSQNVVPQTSNSQQIDKSIPSASSSHGWAQDDDIVEVKAVKKPPHLASKKALKRIEIQEISDVVPQKITITESDSQAFKSRVVEKLEPVAQQALTQQPKENKSMFKRNKEKAAAIKTNNPPGTTSCAAESKDSSNSVGSTLEMDKNDLSEILTKPKTFVQFNHSWKQAKTLPLRYAVLKGLEPSCLPDLFKESLDSATFSEILSVLAERFVAEEDKVFEYLSNLTEVRRFSALTMFMGIQDKQCLMKLFSHIKEHEDRTNEELEALSKKYEL